MVYASIAYFRIGNAALTRIDANAQNVCCFAIKQELPGLIAQNVDVKNTIFFKNEHDMVGCVVRHFVAVNHKSKF